MDGVLITLVLIIARILSSYGAVIITQIAKNFITVADERHPGYKGPFILGWTGMRGVVSLAAALSIPVNMSDGSPFPHRNLILFITFIVILLTLLIQGLTLPYFIKKLLTPTINEAQSEEEIYKSIRKQLSEHALQHLRTNYNNQLKNQPSLQQLALKWENNSNVDLDEQLNVECKIIYFELLDQQRQWLLNKNKEATLDEDIIRRHLYFLDIEEEKLRFL